MQLIMNLGKTAANRKEQISQKFQSFFMNEKKESEVTQSCLTLCNPMDCSLPGFSIHGIFQARVLECGAIPFSDKPEQNFAELLQDECANFVRQK